MNFDEYQKRAEKTALFDAWEDDTKKLAYLALGISGESGEVAEKIKKIIRDNNGEITEDKKQDLIKEIGDVLWYLSQLSRVLGISFSQVAEVNIEKLYSRLSRGKIQGEGDNR